MIMFMYCYSGFSNRVLTLLCASHNQSVNVCLLIMSGKGADVSTPRK
jgi:hypothetical protein